MRPAALICALSLLVAAGLAVGWVFSRPPAAVGNAMALPPPARTLVASPAPPDPHPSRPPPMAHESATPATPPLIGTRSARVAELALARTPAPVRLTLPSLGIDAAVAEVGVSSDGQMEVPADVGTVGWYAPGASPGGGAGSAVLTGHVDSRTQGPGAFFSLQHSHPGDEVVVELDDGTARVYRVVARRRYRKEALPTAELFTTTGPRRLVLITCGGAFDPTQRRYADNVVVVAAPT